MSNDQFEFRPTLPVLCETECDVFKVKKRQEQS